MKFSNIAYVLFFLILNFQIVVDSNFSIFGFYKLTGPFQREFSQWSCIPISIVDSNSYLNWRIPKYLTNGACANVYSSEDKQKFPQQQLQVILWTCAAEPYGERFIYSVSKSPSHQLIIISCLRRKWKVKTTWEKQRAQWRGVFKARCAACLPGCWLVGFGYWINYGSCRPSVFRAHRELEIVLAPLF